MTRYFEFDFDSQTVIEYERHGLCNQCGACCIAVVTFQITQAMREKFSGWDARNGGDRPGDSGRWQAVLIDGRWRFWKLLGVENKGLEFKCGMLTDDKRCKIHTGKTLLSREWPMSPAHVTPFDECSYSFTEKARMSLDEFYKVEPCPVG